MLIIYIVSVILVSVNLTNAQSCTTRSGINSTCVSVHNCEALLPIYQKTRAERTNQEELLLRTSYCSSWETEYKVCCPSGDACSTPEGWPGECKHPNQCRHIVEMLTGPNKKEYTNYVKQLVCKNAGKRKVCCAFSPGTSSPLIQPKPETDPRDECSSAMTTFPPARSSECCGIDGRSSDKIIGGTETAIDQYPWMAAIEYSKLGVITLHCGGSLISGKYVLTAAHCLVGRILTNGRPKNVRLGEYNVITNPDCVTAAGGGQNCNDEVLIVPIQKTIPHPEYILGTLNRRHDIGLIRLKDTAPYTYFIRPICLPSMDYTINPPANFPLYIAGWGLYVQESQLKINSNVKLHVKVPYVPNDICQVSYRNIGEQYKDINISNGQLCAGGEPGKDSCQGDSGGPLMYDTDRVFEVIGVLSFGMQKCGTESVPGVYINVYEYLPWINSTIATVN